MEVPDEPLIFMKASALIKSEEALYYPDFYQWFTMKGVGGENC